MISDSVLRVVVSADFFTAVQRGYLRFPAWLLFFNRFFILYFEKSLLEQLSCPLLVHLLTSLFLNKDLQASRNVSGPACRLNFVDRLSTRPAWASKLIFDILRIYLEGERDDRHHNHRYCAGVQSSLCLSLGHSDNLVHSWLGFHDLVCSLTLHAHV